MERRDHGESETRILRFAAPEALEEFGGTLARELRAGDAVLLSGPLGAGKTTLARGILRGLGWTGPVRSPTFDLLHVYPTSPPVLHADPYRLETAAGLGIEEYLETHLCLVEWPERLGGLLDPAACVRIDLAFEGEARRLRLRPPRNDRSEEV